MTSFLSAVLWNTSIASFLAVLVSCLGQASWFRRRPAAMNVLWMLVLAKFVAPAILSVPILPALINAEEDLTPTRVTDQGVVAAIDAGVTIETAETTLPELVPLPQVATGTVPWTTLLISFSCFVSAMLIVRAALHGVRFHHWLKSVSLPDARLERLLERGRAQMGFSHSPNVRSLDAPCAPFLWAGGRRACIYVPQTVIETLDDEQLIGVLCHELVHHARRDAWASLFASIVAAVCWWNPLVWWVRRELRLTQELCCDARVLERGGQSRRAYAETLLTTLELVTSGVRLPSALASSWDDCESLKRRFQMIGETNVITRLSAGFAVSTLLLGGGLLCLPVHAQVKSPLQPLAVEAQPPDVAVQNVKTRTSAVEPAPLFIHFIGNNQDNSCVHLLTRRVGPTGRFEEVVGGPPLAISPLVFKSGPITLSVKQLTGRLEQRGEQYFADLEYHLAMRDGFFKGEITLDKPTFPVFLAASSVIYPVMFIVTQNPDPGPYINQPFFKKGAEAATAAAAPDDVAASATRIVGRITDPAGKPLADMQIVAAVLPPPPKRAPKPGRRMEWRLAGEVPPSATSDEEGRFTIDKADARATIMLQFDSAELQQPRKWQPKGSLATTISLKVAERESELEVGYVPRSMTSKGSTVDGRVTREVAITWSPTRIVVQWGYAPTIEKWKEARTSAQARDPRWKDGLLATDETVWVVPPGQYEYDEHNQHLDLGPALQLGTSWGQGLRADSEKEIILFFGALDPRTKPPAKP